MESDGAGLIGLPDPVHALLRGLSAVAPAVGVAAYAAALVDDGPVGHGYSVPCWYSAHSVTVSGRCRRTYQPGGTRYAFGIFRPAM